MATVGQHIDGDFVISPAADQALTSVSGDLADLILQIASKHATTTRTDGTRVVTSDDIKKVVVTVCDALENAIKDKTAPTEASEAVKHLRTFCSSIPSENRAR